MYNVVIKHTKKQKTIIMFDNVKRKRPCYFWLFVYTYIL